MSIEALQQQVAEMALRQQHEGQMLQQTAGALRKSHQQQAAAATPARQSASSTSMVDITIFWNERGTEEQVIQLSLSSSILTNPDTVDKRIACLVLWVTGCALDNVQGSGEGEGAAAWRAMQEQ